MKLCFIFCRPTVAGIHGNEVEGCYSLALSGGYEDDLDYGEFFTYTGAGENCTVLSEAYTMYSLCCHYTKTYFDPPSQL